MSASRAVCGPGKLLATSERVVGKAIGNRATRPPTRVQLPTLRPILTQGEAGAKGKAGATMCSRIWGAIMGKALITLSLLSLLAHAVAQEAKPTPGASKGGATPAYYAIPQE